MIVTLSPPQTQRVQERQYCHSCPTQLDSKPAAIVLETVVPAGDL